MRVISTAFIVFVFCAAQTRADDHVSIDFSLSKSEFLSGDIGFLQAVITNKSERKLHCHTSWPAPMIEVQELTNLQLVGPGLSIGGYIRPFDLVYVPPFEVEPKATVCVIAMIRVDLATTRRYELDGLQLTASVRLQDDERVGRFGEDTRELGRVIGATLQVKTTGGIHLSHNDRMSHPLSARIHGYRFHVESQHGWMDHATALLRDSRFPIPDVESWSEIRGDLALDSTLVFLLDLSEQIVELASNSNGDALAKELYRRTALCRSEIEKKWVIHRVHQYLRTRDQAAANELKRIAIQDDLWDCIVGEN